MNYPIYEIKDLEWAEKDGAYDILEFSSFIHELINNEILEHSAEIGVANYIDKNGTNLLSDPQIKVLKIILNKYANENCNRCGTNIPLSEIIESLDNGGYCNSCAYNMSKEED